jgi:hypothetical protein
MRTLAQSLQDRDLGFLRLIKEQWGLELRLRDRQSGSDQLASALLSSAPILDQLSPDGRKLLNELIISGGNIPYAAVVRKFGGIREMGPGKRDREQPWLQPSSPTEDLWYRGLLFRAFVDTDTGPQEVAYIPDDLVPLLPGTPLSQKEPYGHAAEIPTEIEVAGQALFDDAITILAGMRKFGSSFDPHSVSAFLLQPNSLDLLLQLLSEIGVITSAQRKPVSEAMPLFFEDESASRLHLFQAWKSSTLWNDLAQLPLLQPAADRWPNDPLITRTQILSMLERVPTDTWWSFNGFIQGVHAQQPDFQRPAGDFDSWIFQHAETSQAIHGLESWELVDGALLSYVISGPLHWLGIVDLARTPEAPTADSFRIAFHVDTATLPTVEHEGRVRLTPAGEIEVPRTFDPQRRYQLARFCDWIDRSADTFRYRLTPTALQSAADQGLSSKQVIRILNKAIERIPLKHICAAIERWFGQGTEIKVERNAVIRVKRKTTLKELQANPRTARFIQEVIGPKSFTVRPKDLKPLLRSALRASLLIDFDEQY